MVGGMLIFYTQCFAEVHWSWVQASPTLDLVNECSYFVTAFFGIICKSAPHICHSIASQMVVQRSKPYIHSFVRIVHVVPPSQEQAIGRALYPFTETFAWSPCYKSIILVQPVSIIEIGPTQRQIKNTFTLDH